MAKKKVKRTSTPKMSESGVRRNQFMGMVLIAVGVGALIVFVRYLAVTMVQPADVYLVEPGQLIPGQQQTLSLP